MEILLVFMGTALINNVVLSRSLGICPFIGVSKQLSSSVGMGAAVAFVMTMASAVIFVLYNYVLVPLSITFLYIIVFIFVIACLVQLVDMFLKKYSKPLHKSLGIYLPLITTNCAVLGIMLLSLEMYYSSFILTIAHALGGAAGFTLALVLFAGIRERFEDSDIPKVFKGLPITMIAAGLMSLVFFAFMGMF
jgi:electron transport complex protein RnfA